LYALHAVLTGLAMVLMNVMQVRLGFSFSAGLFDYVINFGQATRPWMLLPVGLAYFALYYGTFRFVIRRFALPTPGRESDAPEAVATVPESDRARALVAALGGARNLVSVDACTTRLRLVVSDQAAVDEAALQSLGARGLVRPSADSLQVVLGPIADQVAGEIRDALRGTEFEAIRPAGRVSQLPKTQAAGGQVDAELLSRLLTALGGRGNVAALDSASTRILVTLREAAVVDIPVLESLGLRGVARPAPTSLHLVVGPDAAATLYGLRRLIGNEA
ncbi:MAG: glucose PTS transporter subunit EIIB, partial [Steroidobacteraceae bacterium]